MSCIETIFTNIWFLILHHKVKFGPDRNLYVGTIKGQIAKITFKDGGYTELQDMVVSMVSQWRPILGMAFDPMDTSGNPAVYVTTNNFFHVSSIALISLHGFPSCLYSLDLGCTASLKWDREMSTIHQKVSWTLHQAIVFRFVARQCTNISP